MFAQAKSYNQINTQLKKILPNALNSLELCRIKEKTATLIAPSQAVAFRAKKQQQFLLASLKRLDTLSSIQTIVIKVDLGI